MLREWQLWHTFASYFVEALPPLETVAENLVRWGVAECAVTSEGSAWWSNDDPTMPPSRTDRRQKPVGQGKVKIEPTYDQRSAQVHFLLMYLTTPRKR